MATFENPDAELIAEGIRLSGKAEAVDDFVRSMSRPVSVDQLEYITRPDAFAEYGLRAAAGLGFEHVGMLKIAAVEGGFTIAALWFGWLPGVYATRDAALVAYGYALGGEQHGHLEDLTRGGSSITADDVRALTLR